MQADAERERRRLAQLRARISMGDPTERRSAAWPCCCVSELPTSLMLALHLALACDSLAVLPSATADGLGGLYAKNADRSRNEAQPIAVL